MIKGYNRKIIITNQHCDNRGDESATIGIIEEVYVNFGKDTEIIMFKQTRDYQFIPSEYGVTEINMDRDTMFLLQSMLWILFRCLHIDIRFMLSKRMKQFLTMHEEADIVLSSCGGPYIGDIYVNHEIQHIIYLLIPELLGKSVFFTAPSMGPFQIKIANPLRKSVLKRAKLIVLRDQVSYDYVVDFLGSKDKVCLAADACFADEIKDKKALDERKNMIGFTPLEYKYPNSADRDVEVEQYKQCIIRLFDELMETDKELRIQFFPQLYNKHSDMELIHEFISRMKYSDRAVCFSDKKSGILQQREIGNMKMMIATRYHSAVFANKMYVPCICIAYEHKATAMMNSFGLGECVVDINDLNYDILKEKYLYVKEHYQEIYDRQVEKLPAITEKAKSIIKYVQEICDDGSGIS